MNNLNQTKIKIFVLIVLISTLSFGLGFLAGSRFYEPNPIIIQKSS